MNNDTLCLQREKEWEQIKKEIDNRLMIIGAYSKNNEDNRTPESGQFSRTREDFTEERIDNKEQSPNQSPGQEMTFRGFMYIGAPKIGKTTLLDCIEQKIKSEFFEGEENILVARIDYSRQRDETIITWDRIWEQLYICAPNIHTKNKLDDVTKILLENRECEEDKEKELFRRRNFFHELTRILPILLLIDNFDIGYKHRSETHPSQAVSLIEIFHWNIIAVTTTTDPLSFPRYWDLFYEERLLMFNRKNAEKLIEHSCGQNNTKKKIIDVAGQHPFLITRYCQILTSQEKKDPNLVESRLRNDEKVRSWLKSTWKYLDLLSHYEANYVLSRLLENKTGEDNGDWKKGIKWLRFCGIVPPDSDRISSAIVADYLRDRLTEPEKRKYRKLLRQMSQCFDRFLLKYKWTLFWAIFISWLAVVSVMRLSRTRGFWIIFVTTLSLVILFIIAFKREYASYRGGDGQ